MSKMSVLDLNPCSPPKGPTRWRRFRRRGLPRAQRTREWKSAVGMLSSPDVYIEAEGRVSYLFRDFYIFAIRIDELQGG
jgi:hypothetical protein